MRIWACLLLCFVGSLAVQAQPTSLAERNSTWETRSVIDLPGDDEGDDEEYDCPTYPMQLPSTGVTECWNLEDVLIPCTGTGQDGEYQLGVPSPSPRFTDNNDGTVADHRTGLIWLQRVACFDDAYWLSAIGVANGLADGECGLMDESLPGDWRLPNLVELMSLVDFTQAHPALPLGHPFDLTGVQSNAYWTSTTVAFFPGNAWFVNWGDLGHPGSDVKGDLFGVWPVRGPE